MERARMKEKKEQSKVSDEIPKKRKLPVLGGVTLKIEKAEKKGR
jgi:hypothetical protein